MTTFNDDIFTPKMMNHIESHLGGVKSEYINGTRKSAFYDANKEISSQNFDVKFVKLFVDGLKSDILNSRSNKEVSDCAFFAPRRSGKRKDFVNQIAFQLYPPKSNDAEGIKKSYISYQKCLSTLNKKFKEQEFAKIVEKEKFKMARLSEHKNLWCTLKKRPLSKVVTQPTAMPVVVSGEDELKSFFNFLKNDFDINEMVEGNDSKWIQEEKCLKFNRGAIYTDGRMDLCKQVVGPTWIDKLMDSIVDNTHVKHFLLGNNIIGSVGAKAIKKFLLNQHKPKIETWYLAGNDIDEEGISDIVDGLQYDTDVKELWLKRNPIKSNGMMHIERLLTNNKSIDTLDLHNVAILDDGMKYLVNGLMNNDTLKKIYLEGNGITEVGVDYLVSYFDYLVSSDKVGITSLWIGMNRLGDLGVEKLVKSLKNYKYLERLCIGSNMISHVGMEHVYEAFKNHNKIFLLDVGMYKSTADMGEITNRISDIGADYVAKLIRENNSLQYLSILHNDISNDSMKNICDALQTNNKILFMDFKQYYVGLDSDVYRKIKNKLDENRKLVNVTDAGLYSRFLKHTKEILHIDSIYRNNDKQ